jgi:hypothetical protein
MIEKIIGFLREYVLAFSIITLIIGIILLLIGAAYIWPDLPLGIIKETAQNLGGYSAYILVVGLIAIITGLYYIYSFYHNRNILLEEIETKKRSEFIKKHNELKNIARHLPSKYRTMLEEKEKELHIK